MILIIQFAELTLLLIVATQTTATYRIAPGGGPSGGEATSAGQNGFVKLGDGHCDQGWHVVDRKAFWGYNDDQSPGLSSVFHAEDRIHVLFNTKLPAQVRSIWQGAHWMFQYIEAGNTTVAAYPIGADAHGHTLIIQGRLPAQLVDQGQLEPLHLNIEVVTPTGKHHWYKDVPYCLYPPASSANVFKDLVACTQIKASVAHLAPEWVLYHHLQGFQHFYIYVNDELDNIRKVQHHLQPLVDDSIVTIINWNWHPHHMHDFYYQQAEQNACLARQRSRARWVGLHDIDEFFQPMTNGTVSDWLSKHGDLEHVGALRVNHIFFGSHANSSKQSEHTRRGKGLTISKYVHRAAAMVPDRAKILARPSSVQYMSIHQVTTGGHSTSPDPWNELRLVHYRSPGEQYYEVLDSSMYVYTDILWEKLKSYGYEQEQWEHVHTRPHNNTS